MLGPSADLPPFAGADAARCWRAARLPLALGSAALGAAAWCAHHDAAWPALFLGAVAGLWIGAAVHFWTREEHRVIREGFARQLARVRAAADGILGGAELPGFRPTRLDVLERDPRRPRG